LSSHYLKVCLKVCWPSLILTALTLATVEQWDKIFAINVRGVFLCYKYAGKQMVAQGRGGRMVGACSVPGKRGSEYINEIRKSLS